METEEHRKVISAEEEGAEDHLPDEPYDQAAPVGHIADYSGDNGGISLSGRETDDDNLNNEPRIPCEVVDSELSPSEMKGKCSYESELPHEEKASSTGDEMVCEQGSPSSVSSVQCEVGVLNAETNHTLVTDVNVPSSDLCHPQPDTDDSFIQWLAGQTDETREYICSTPVSTSQKKSTKSTGEASPAIFSETEREVDAAQNVAKERQPFHSSESEYPVIFPIRRSENRAPGNTDDASPFENALFAAMCAVQRSVGDYLEFITATCYPQNCSGTLKARIDSLTRLLYVHRDVSGEIIHDDRFFKALLSRKQSVPTSVKGAVAQTNKPALEQEEGQRVFAILATNECEVVRMIQKLSDLLREFQGNKEASVEERKSFLSNIITGPAKRMLSLINAISEVLKSDIFRIEKCQGIARILNFQVWHLEKIVTGIRNYFRWQMSRSRYVSQRETLAQPCFTEARASSESDDDDRMLQHPMLTLSIIAEEGKRELEDRSLQDGDGSCDSGIAGGPETTEIGETLNSEPDSVVEPFSFDGDHEA